MYEIFTQAMRRFIQHIHTHCLENIFCLSLQPPPIPLKRCNTSFDATAWLGGDSYWFKDKYFWIWGGEDDQAKEILSVWPQLPANFTRIDAVFKPFVDQVWFFIGTEIYIFDGERFKQKSSLNEIGIDEAKYLKIDAIFRWPDKDHSRFAKIKNLCNVIIGTVQKAILYYKINLY